MRWAPPFLLTLSACGGSLNESGVRGAIGGQLGRDPALASAICGYAVEGLVTYDEATREHLGVDARKPMFGTPEADVVGVPTPAPGVPAGPTCAGKIQFGYEVISQANYRGDGAVALLRGLIKVLSRSTIPPAEVPPRYRIENPAFAMPIALGTPATGGAVGGSRKFAGRYVWAPGEPNERIYGDYEIVLDEGPLHITANCGTDISREVGDSGDNNPRIELYRGDEKLALMGTDNSGYGGIYPAKRKVTIEINYNGGSADGYVLSTPGTYRLHVRADCPYQLYLDRVSGAHPPPHVPH